MATVKIQPSLHVQPTVGQTFCYAVEKNIQRTVFTNTMYVCACVCVFYFLPLKQCYTNGDFVHVKTEETTWKGHGEDEI